MTTYLVVSDIHANYPALEAVVADAPETDGVICCGDIVGLMGFPAETVSWLQANVDRCVAGNHDVAVLEYGEGHVNDPDLSMFELTYTQEALDDEQIEWVNDLPTYAEYRDSGLLLAHAKPSVEFSAGYKMGNHGVRPRDVTGFVPQLPAWVDTLLVGHTHKQHSVDCSKFGHRVLVCNPGSVGQPLGTARYGILDTDERSFEHRRVEYDSEPVVERLRDCDVPLEWWD